ncbi:site-specific integrase [Rhizobium laguerreae]|uniref:site-specific integrase n=1 Tax=Rhizobium laguerreae TaxID=1076926 RepID=UPI001441E735|nr:site-specific integrase [Rhizobium laguerreae]NKM67630.1 tyrosine-type recombinase/integrase [Rhizobium laguerreae]
MPIFIGHSDAAAPAAPTHHDIRRIWRVEGRLSAGTMTVYLNRIQQFRTFCALHGLVEREELTLEQVGRFIDWYAKRRGLDPRSLHLSRSALQALNRVYHLMRLSPPDWRPPRSMKVKPPSTPLLAQYAAYLTQHRGNPQATVHKKLDHLGKLSDHLVLGNRDWHSMQLVDIDAFLVDCAARYSQSHVGDIACTVRCFCRFLHWSGRSPVDISEAVIAPVQRRYERPRRALSWEDVQRLLRAVDRSSPRGLRDYAILLMMSVYGFGAGEIIRLQFQDIDWDAGTLSVCRPKTGVAFTLPLLPPVAEALAHYLRHGRPADTPTRHLFVPLKMPLEAFVGSSAIRHIVVKHAKIAGIDAPFLGSHVLRHSHAARQIDLGARPQVVSELLGHRDPESVSAYVRIATTSLREVALPVPT